MVVWNRSLPLGYDQEVSHASTLRPLSLELLSLPIARHFPCAIASAPSQESRYSASTEAVSCTVTTP
jgi:hypothetical protein